MRPRFRAIGFPPLRSTPDRCTLLAACTAFLISASVCEMLRGAADRAPDSVADRAADRVAGGGAAHPASSVAPKVAAARTASTPRRNAATSRVLVGAVERVHMALIPPLV